MPPRKSAKIQVTDTCQTKHAHGLGVNEEKIQKILAKAEKPLSAYDVVSALSKLLKRNVAPMTVYRALQHLCAHGIVSRIESSNTYVLCRHPQEDHHCLFFICRNCGTATEAPDQSIRNTLKKEAQKFGFDINRQVLEVIGLCKDCAE
ncbi:MAG: transcriptional repressor [Alphaproteobacteria bacterium]|nr:transcriptional repressor [Alphaproteobacteria bacterium]MBV8549441.1 transcriptional repressor [Alphaproteobacteria bacterium]